MSGPRSRRPHGEGFWPHLLFPPRSQAGRDLGVVKAGQRVVLVVHWRGCHCCRRPEVASQDIVDAMRFVGV